MEAILRGAVVYLFLFFLFRLLGKRSLAAITTFDFVLLLIISEATQQALLGNDMSIINSIIVICTLVGIELVLSLVSYWVPSLQPMIEDKALLLIVNGRPIQENIDKERVDLESILENAREQQGLERLEQIRFAVLERNGHISIVPKPGEGR